MVTVVGGRTSQFNAREAPRYGTAKGAQKTDVTFLRRSLLSLRAPRPRDSATGLLLAVDDGNLLLGADDARVAILVGAAAPPQPRDAIFDELQCVSAGGARTRGRGCTKRRTVSPAMIAILFLQYSESHVSHVSPSKRAERKMSPMDAKSPSNHTTTSCLVKCGSFDMGSRKDMFTLRRSSAAAPWHLSVASS